MPAAALLLVAVVLGIVLLTVAALAWGQPATMRGWISALQAAYGTAYDGPFLLRADVHVHILVSLLVSLWFGALCRLFAPRWLPWVPLALAMLVGLIDEVMQLGSTARSFDLTDQAASAFGLLIALPVLMLLARMPVRSGPKRPPPASPRQ